MSGVAVNLVHPRGKLAGVLSQQCRRNISKRVRGETDSKRAFLADASGYQRPWKQSGRRSSAYG